MLHEAAAGETRDANRVLFASASRAERREFGEGSGADVLISSELSADEPDDAAVGDDDVATPIQVGEEGVDAGFQLCDGFASGRDEIVEVGQRLAVGRCELVPGRAFEFAEVEFTQSGIGCRFEACELCGLLAPTEVGGPRPGGLRMGEFFVQCPCLEPTSVGENGVGPSVEAAIGGPGGFAVADQPDFESRSGPWRVRGRSGLLGFRHSFSKDGRKPCNGYSGPVGSGVLLRSGASFGHPEAVRIAVPSADGLARLETALAVTEPPDA